jgi:hypothetical protein
LKVGYMVDYTSDIYEYWGVRYGRCKAYMG